MFNINTLITPGINIANNFFLLNLFQSNPEMNTYKKMNIIIESIPEQGLSIATLKLLKSIIGRYSLKVSVVGEIKFKSQDTTLAII